MAQERPTVSERVIREVATAANRDALELPILRDAIEPDALNALVDRMVDGEVTFAYAGYDVTVTSDETITVEEHPASEAGAEMAVTDGR